MPQVMRFGCELGVFLRPENNLREPFPVAQINEDDAAVIAENMHPAGEHGGGANVAFAQLIAVMSPVHVRCDAPPKAQQLSRSRPIRANTGNVKRGHDIEQTIIILDAHHPPGSDKNVIWMWHLEYASTAQFDAKWLKRHRANPLPKFLKHGVKITLSFGRMKP